MSDHKLAFIFFEIGMIFCVVAMILGPVGVEIWSVACSVVAIILACMGIYLAFCSWNEVPPVRKKTAPGGGESLPNQGGGRGKRPNGDGGTPAYALRG